MTGAQITQSESKERARKLSKTILFASVFPGLLGAIFGVVAHLNKFIYPFVPIFFGGLCVASGVIPFVVLARSARRSIENQQSSPSVWIGGFLGGCVASAWMASQICVDTEGLIMLMITGMGEGMMIVAVSVGMLVGLGAGWLVHRLASRKHVTVGPCL